MHKKTGAGRCLKRENDPGARGDREKGESHGSEARSNCPPVQIASAGLATCFRSAGRRRLPRYFVELRAIPLKRINFQGHS